MSLNPLADSKRKSIIENIIAACKDINKLDETGYGYINLASGFLAHYNLEGFIDYYREPGSLQRDIFANARQNRWDNFRPGDQNYEYYHQKGEIYSKIIDGLQKSMLFRIVD